MPRANKRGDMRRGRDVSAARIYYITKIVSSVNSSRTECGEKERTRDALISNGIDDPVLSELSLGDA